MADVNPGCSSLALFESGTALLFAAVLRSKTPGEQDAL